MRALSLLAPISRSLLFASLMVGARPLSAQNFGDGFAAENFVVPTMPEGISADVEDISFDPDTGVGSFGGPISLRTDNGMSVNALRGTFDYKKQTGTLTGAVALKQRATDGTYGVEIFADKATIDHKAKEVVLTGDVSIYTGETLQRGAKAYYNYSTRAFRTEGMRSGVDPILLEAGKFEMQTVGGRRVFVGEGAGITTHDVERPDYWLKADRTTVFPGEKVVFRDMRLVAGDRTLFWLPYLSQPLDAELGYLFIPGARSNLGPFLLNRYGVMLGGERDPVTGENVDAWLLSQWHVDLYSRRGIGTGVDLRDIRDSDNENITGLSLYYLHDFDPGLRRSGLPRNFSNNDRYIVRLQQKVDLPDIAGYDLVAFADLNFISDRFYLEDFQPRTFRENPEPDNIIGIRAQEDFNVFHLFTRLRLNDFYQVDERLPELAFDQLRRPIFGSRVMHEGQTSFGIYRENVADFREGSLRAERAGLLPGDPRIAEIDALLAGQGFTRFHTYQELSRPFRFNRWLRVTPRAGAGYTSYHDVVGTGASQDRTLLFAGVDVSADFSKDYANVQSERWALDGLKHVITPYADVSWVRTNELDSSFGRIDRLSPSTRPRQRGVGRFSAIDDLADWTVFRLGMRNSLLTRRDGGTHQWLTLDTYVDAFADDPELNRSVSNLYNELRWHPVPWMRFEFDTQFPIIDGGSGFSEVVTGATFMPSEDLEFQVRHRLLDNHPILLDSNQIDMRVFARINDLWGIDVYHRWELDDSTLEIQQYELQRNFGSWTVGAGLHLRDNREEDEFSFLLTFTLNEFPRVELPVSVDTQ